MKRPAFLSMAEAVREFVRPRSPMYIGGFAYSEPMAFAHEVIRRGCADLDIIKSSGGVLVDQLVGAGCVRRLLSCHVWNSVGPVPAHCFRRAMEQGVPRTLELEELSFGVMTLAFFAGACDLPFVPVTPVQGAGHFTVRGFLGEGKFAVVPSPFTGEPACVVPPLKPALGILQAQRVDPQGNAQVLGPLAEMKYAINACDQVVVVAEEVVPTEEVKRSAHLTVIPGFRVAAVVIEPWAGHPSDLYGYYHRDLKHYVLYGQMSRTAEGFRQYVEEWILGTGDHRGYIKKLGEATLESLRSPLRAGRWR